MVTGRTKDGSVFPLTVRFIASASVVADPVVPKKMRPSIDEDTVLPTQHISETVMRTNDNLKNEEEEEEEEEEEGEWEGKTAQHEPTLEEGHKADFFLNGRVIVYSAVSGMLSFFPDGTIHGCNHHFSLMMFGYNQQELVKKVAITVLPPSPPPTVVGEINATVLLML